MANNIQKNFGLSYKDFKQNAQDLSINMERDQLELAEFGVSFQDIENFEKLRLDFEDSSYDIVLKNKQKIATKEKNETALKLAKSLYYMQLKSEIAAKETTKNLSLIQIENITALTFDELRTIAESYLYILTQDIETLDQYGLKLEDYTNYKLRVEEFSATFVKQGVAGIRRKLATQIRTKKANHLYELYTKYSHLGRKMWALTNEIYSQSYVIYSKSIKKRKKKNNSSSED